MHSKTYPVTLASRDEKPSLSSSEEKSSEFGWLEIKRKWKWKRRKKQSKALYILYIYISIYLLQWMQGNIYRDVFPTFLTKKSYGWWITRRRMEIIQKYLKKNIQSVGRKYLEASGEHRNTIQNCLWNSPGRRYWRIRIRPSGEVETPPLPSGSWIPDVNIRGGKCAAAKV